VTARRVTRGQAAATYRFVARGALVGISTTLPLAYRRPLLGLRGNALCRRRTLKHLVNDKTDGVPAFWRQERLPTAAWWTPRAHS